jgi:hypothetical protein
LARKVNDAMAVATVLQGACMLEFVVSGMPPTGAGRSRHNDSERISFELS